MATKATDVQGPTYRFGDKAGESGISAWQAINQTFSTLKTKDGNQLDSEWLLIQAGGFSGFVDLINGTLVPVTAVIYALPT